MIDRVIAEAESHSRPVVVVPTASAAKAVTARIEAPAEARSTAAALEPQPFAPDRLAAVKALETALEGAPKGSPSIVWLSDGIDHDGKAAETAATPESLWQRTEPLPSSPAAAAGRRSVCSPASARAASWTRV